MFELDYLLKVPKNLFIKIVNDAIFFSQWIKAKQFLNAPNYYFLQILKGTLLMIEINLLSG